ETASEHSSDKSNNYKRALLPFGPSCVFFLNRKVRVSSDIFWSAEWTSRMMSLSLFSSWGDFFSAKSATATSLLNSLEIAILQRNSIENLTGISGGRHRRFP